jgi:pyruvate formate lyase activating enzyme
MVPGYIVAREVGQISGFIASLDTEIPYSLLAFHSQYRMTDLAATSRKQAHECLDADKQPGLSQVRVGNVHLLW